MRTLIRRLQLNICVAFAAIVFVTGCGTPDNDDITEKPVSTGFEIPETGTYDSVDNGAIIVSVDKDAKTVTFHNRKVNRNYTLNYDGTGKVYDKYGSALVMEQLACGDVVDVTFLKSKKLMNSISKSADVWEYTDVKDFEIDELTGRITLPDGKYRFNKDLLIFSEGNKSQLIDINPCDTLKISGSEHDIYSIVIEQGHGYLRLKGQEYFEGGWIEVGNKIIKTVSKDMLIAVPVGSYDVRLSNGDYEGKRSVTIEKNRETELDVSDMVQPDETKYGAIVFVTDPSDAEIYADGEKVDTTKPLSLEYGIHQLIVRAEGYDTLTQYIKVGQESATMEITLEKVKEPSAGGNVGPSPSPAPVVTTFVTQAVTAFETSDYKVKVEAPEGVEVYVDGSYVGIAPVEFAKMPGSHVITLRKDGYETRSYTITLDSLLQNETFSFAELKSENGEEEE
ncbi:MAG: PEGA domain-containing protein [Lachnospiraceae bacterium]|nr:PEGA domain-containing protein [Lachnospiraceae bacterium]